MAEIGFDGNQDLYGVGYYTTALSLWISHVWAPSEAHFLHPITITFLLAMIVGVSVLSRVPSEVYAIEPFMLMQISYYTYFMGLGGPKRPDFLSWERDYTKFFLTRFIGLLLLGYDTWYWFRGIWLMRPSPGVETAAIMLYFGRVDIFKWISYVMRAIVILLLLYTIYTIIEALYQQWWEKRLDHQVPPERLKYLADRWAMVWTQDDAFAAPNGRKDSRKPVSPPMLRHVSSTSVRSAPISRWNSEMEDLDSVKDKLRNEISWRSSLTGTRSELDDESKSRGTPWTAGVTCEAEPEPQVVRTMTDQFKKTLMGWQPDHPIVDGQPLYKYTPTLEGLATSLELLRSLNQKYCGKCLILTYYYDWSIRFTKLICALISHQFRPQVLLACKVHLRNLDCNRMNFQMIMLRRMLEHPAYNKVMPEDIHLASRILMTYEKPRKPSGWPYFAILWTSFMTCSLLVISTELAIQWSAIRGVQNIGSVGQLIPMAIGVCGLFKTCWTALLDKQHGETWCFGACRGSKKGAEWAAACESFDRARAAWQRTLTPADDHDEHRKELDKEKDVNV